jgi:hypothetical protein
MSIEPIASGAAASHSPELIPARGAAPAALAVGGDEGAMPAQLADGAPRPHTVCVRGP